MRNIFISVAEYYLLGKKYNITYTHPNYLRPQYSPKTGENIVFKSKFYNLLNVV